MSVKYFHTQAGLILEVIRIIKKLNKLKKNVIGSNRPNRSIINNLPYLLSHLKPQSSERSPLYLPPQPILHGNTHDCM